MGFKMFVHNSLVHKHKFSEATHLTMAIIDHSTHDEALLVINQMYNRLVWEMLTS